ncbi:MAG: chemotaxis response regulator protein-glutamate methylesterase [Pseudomonadota bacterium]|nr:chemotaxis response regulator protein-glutamate methylesterase [Pseudomonadota bacterium]
MRVAIVDDSTMAVESLRRVLASLPNIQLAWVARDGAEAVWRCTLDKPDLILMDLIMPVMDGVEATRKIMASTPCAILIVTSTVAGNASKAFQAMGFGALDAVNTPVLGSAGDGPGKEELLAKIATICKLVCNKREDVVVPRAEKGLSRVVASSDAALVAIGASSGGPHALAEVLSALPADFSSPVVIIQHVDENFSSELAQWLDKKCALNVKLARSGDSLMPGQVLIAGTNDHLIIRPDNLLDYTPFPREMSYRPSVDIFFNSVADNWKGNVVAVLLTGMGRDGAEGLLHLRNKGMHTIAQNEATCAVYGMPKAAVKLNAAVDILPLDQIGSALVTLLPARYRRKG